MAKRRRKRAPPMPLPLLFVELAFASWETMLRRTAMMAAGTCTAAEYQRMVVEKLEAARRSALALAKPSSKRTVRAVVGPWHRRARANAKRLR
jgi:hypothetical protein